MGSLIAVLLAAGGCGSPEEPPPAPMPAAKMKAPMPAAPPAVPEKPVPPPPVAVATVPADAGRPAPKGPEKGPEPGTEFDPAISTSTFSFRTMDHQKADVFINGRPSDPTVCLWSVTMNTAFDPKIPVSTWPPPAARPCGSGIRKLGDGTPYSEVELWIEGGHYEQEEFARTRKRLPHLADGEQILYVKAKLCGATRTGAVRIQLLGKDRAIYRWIDFTAYLSDEDENTQFKHALWFYALRPE